MKRYRFLLFDADKTLLDFDTDMLHAFQATYEACFGSQRPYSPQLLEQYEACNTAGGKSWSGGSAPSPSFLRGASGLPPGDRPYRPAGGNQPPVL